MTDLFLVVVLAFVFLFIIFGVLSRVRTIVFDLLNNNKMQITSVATEKLEGVLTPKMNYTFSVSYCFHYRY